MNRLLIALIVSAGTLGGAKAAEPTPDTLGTAMAGLTISHDVCGTSHADVTTGKKWLYILAAANGMNSAVVDEAAAASWLASFNTTVSPNLIVYEAKKAGACVAVDEFVSTAKAAGF